MATYGPIHERIGGSLVQKSPIASGAHNFRRNYYYSTGSSGDVRVQYEDLYVNSTGSGEVIRVRGIANGTGVATGGTVNGIHATGRVASGKTVSGSLNGIRATLEVAGTTPTPGGKLSALRVDSNIVTGWTDSSGANASSFISVGNVGAGLVGNLFSIDDAIATKSDTAVVTTVAADAVCSHGIRINMAGTTGWIMVRTDTPAD